jgi:hypothetical protein
MHIFHIFHFARRGELPLFLFTLKTPTYSFGEPVVDGISSGVRILDPMTRAPPTRLACAHRRTQTGAPNTSHAKYITALNPLQVSRAVAFRLQHSIGHIYIGTNADTGFALYLEPYRFRAGVTLSSFSLFFFQYRTRSPK